MAILAGTFLLQTLQYTQTSELRVEVNEKLSAIDRKVTHVENEIKNEINNLKDRMDCMATKRDIGALQELVALAIINNERKR